MILYNGQLKILHDMVCRKEHLKEKYEELIEQKSVLQEEVDKLQKISIKNQADVDKLECGSLASFFLNVIGKKDEKLNKKKEEAYAAKVKCDAAKRELEKIESEFWRMEEELSKLHGCEAEYEALLVQKKEHMKIIGHEDMAKVFELDRRMTYLDNQNREIDEAIEAGNIALEVTNQVLKEQIVSLIGKLQRMKEKVVEEREQTQNKLDELIVHVNM